MIRIENTHVQLALYGLRPWQRPHNVAAAIVARKSGLEAAKAAQEADAVAKVRKIVAGHSDELQAIGVAP